MIQPDELKRNEPLKWSPGIGTDVWEMLCAAIAGDVPTIKRLLDKDPSLVRCNYSYRTPLYFAVRENRVAVASYLLERGADPLGGRLLEVTRDRGYAEMQKLLEATLASVHNASPKGNAVAEAIRQRDLARLRSLLDAAPELLHAGDERSNQPIHWAVMTRICAKRGSPRTATHCIRPSTMPTSRPPSFCWNTAPTRIRQSKVPRTR